MPESRLCGECGFKGEYDCSPARADFYFRRHNCGHGSTGYDRGCRCGVCQEGHTSRNKHWRLLNPEKQRKYSKEYSEEYRRKHPELIREMKQRWIDSNPDKRREVAREYAKRWYTVNSDRANASSRKWYAENRVYALDKQKRRGKGLGGDRSARRARWTRHEDIMIWDMEMTLLELSLLLGRTPAAIVQRRVSQRKIVSKIRP